MPEAFNLAYWSLPYDWGNSNPYALSKGMSQNLWSHNGWGRNWSILQPFWCERYVIPWITVWPLPVHSQRRCLTAAGSGPFGGPSCDLKRLGAGWIQRKLHSFTKIRWIGLILGETLFFPSLCFDWWPRDFRNGEEIQPTSSELQTKTTRPVHPAAGLRPHVGTRAPPRMCAWTQWFQRWIWDENIPTGDDDHPNDYSFYLFFDVETTARIARKRNDYCCSLDE